MNLGARRRHRLASVAALAVALSTALTVPTVALARLAPAADEPSELEILEARPTGMEDDAWRKRRLEIAAELGERRDKDAVEPLLKIVETERYDAVLSIAIESLGKIGDARAVAPLQRIYADRSIDTFVRDDAAAALRQLGQTPRDDARLAPGAAGADTSADEPLVAGPQLGTMGEASVAPEEQDDPTARDKPLPANVRARERAFTFVLGQLDLGVDTASKQQPLLADGGVAARAYYVDERARWGFAVRGELGSRVRNGDVTSLPDMGDDTGDVFFVAQSLAGAGDAHVYFGRTDVHAFGELGISQRLVHVGVENFGGGQQSRLSDTRVSLDVIPAGGLGYGRYLNRGSDLVVDALVDALRSENNLAHEPDEETRRALRDAIYRRSNTFSAWPRTAAVLAVLRARGLLARRESARLVHRIRSIVEDPSYVDRPRGVRVRAGFLYDAAIAQADRLRRGDGVGAPFVQLDAGIQLGLERQVLIDTRLWYDVIARRGFTTDTGATYTRFLHTKFHDYAGQWFTGVRGGVSGREYDDLPDGVATPRIGYRATARAGYAFGFRRGSQVAVVGESGVDSGAFVLGLAVGLQIGIARGSVWNPASTPVAPAGRPKR